MIIKGKITGLEVRTYSDDKDRKYLQKQIFVTKNFRHVLTVDIDGKGINNKFFTNYPFLYEGIKVNLYGEFEFPEKTYNGKINPDIRFIDVNIKKLDNIELDM